MLLFRSDQKKMIFIRLAVQKEDDNDSKLTLYYHIATKFIRHNYLQRYILIINTRSQLPDILHSYSSTHIGLQKRKRSR